MGNYVSVTDICFSVMLQGRCFIWEYWVYKPKFLRRFPCDKVKTFVISYENILVLCSIIRAALITFENWISWYFKTRNCWFIIEVVLKTTTVSVCILLVSSISFAICYFFNKLRFWNLIIRAYDLPISKTRQWLFGSQITVALIAWFEGQ